MLREFYGRITEFLSTANNVLSRRIRVVSGRLRRAYRQPSNDWSRPDYDFWHKAYYCQAKGLELSGLFIKPLVNKLAAWSLGRPPQFKLDNNETAVESLADWWNKSHPTILRGWREALKQGDAFIVVNSDLTLTIVSPDITDPLVADDDYSNIIGWRVTQTLTHPELTATKMTMIDEYTAERRVHRMEIDGRITSEQIFPNLIGKVPIVHIANDPSPGPFGHPAAEALVEVLHRHGEVLEAGIEGNKLQGRPTPVINFETITDLEKFWDSYGDTETQTLPDGTAETVTTLAVDLNEILTLSGATFSYESPGSFVEDTKGLLELMFYLVLEHTEIPEFVFGNAIASSMASAETQLPVFIKFIEMVQGDTRGWLINLAEVVLAYMGILQPAVGGDLTSSPILQFEPLADSDGRLTLDTLTWAYGEGLLDDHTALSMAPLDIEDIDGVLQRAKEEAEERRKQFEENALGNDPMAIFRDEVNRTKDLETED